MHGRHHALAERVARIAEPLRDPAGARAARAGRAVSARGASGAHGLRLLLISVHGLIRGHDLELGRDADTGGQTKYVVELVRELARRPEVEQVDLVTRRITAPEVSADYGREIEALGEGARIVRLDAGPPEVYFPKEALWDHLDAFADNLAAWIAEQPRPPDLIHGHYADAGHVGSRLAHLLGIPLVQTGHSLGRVKRRRLLASGLSTHEIDARYAMSRRIEAEEDTLAAAARVIVSTRQEIEEQYALYDHYRPERMSVVPPGTDLELFHPPVGDEPRSAIAAELRRFLRAPDKPLIMALSRPDPRKNIGALVEAYGRSPRLQELANLLVVAGGRDDIAELEPGAQEVLTELLLAVDRHDLYGKVAYPKRHAADDVPVMYRLAAASGGVFVNPALTEPFGLTLIEAAASGLPVVATEDGGPRDITANCRNGLLVDPLDTDAIAAALLEILEHDTEREAMVERGLAGVREHYSWEAHARTYLEVVRPVVEGRAAPEPPPPVRRATLYGDRGLFADLDQSLLGDTEGLHELLATLREHRRSIVTGLVTGRRLDTALRLLREHRIPTPDVLITSGGTAIHAEGDLTEDAFWTQHIEHGWTPHVVRRVLARVPGLTQQPASEQSRFKVSFDIEPEEAPGIDEINSLLHQEGCAVNVVVSHGRFLDVLPVRASRGLALRHVMRQRGIPLERVLVAGGSGADEDMLRGNTLAVVVANRHDEELSHLVEAERIYFAEQPYARGILEAIEHFDFFDTCRAPPADRAPAAEAGAP